MKFERKKKTIETIRITFFFLCFIKFVNYTKLALLNIPEDVLPASLHHYTIINDNEFPSRLRNYFSVCLLLFFSLSRISGYVNYFIFVTIIDVSIISTFNFTFNQLTNYAIVNF